MQFAGLAIVGGGISEVEQVLSRFVGLRPAGRSAVKRLELVLDGS